MFDEPITPIFEFQHPHKYFALCTTPVTRTFPNLDEEKALPLLRENLNSSCLSPRFVSLDKKNRRRDEFDVGESEVGESGGS